MDKSAPRYQRLTGKRRTPVGFTQLWLAQDHLLLVRSTRFTEIYQRFSLADIQGIVVTERPANIVLQMIAIAGLVAAVALYLAISLFFAKILIALGTSIVLAGLVANLAAGPRCHCRLQTAVSSELLPPVSRVRTAKRFLARIRPVIEAVQGSLAPERASAIEIPVEKVEKPPDVPNAPTYLPETLFGLFLIDAALVLASVRFPRAELAGILFTTLFGEILLAVVALIRRGGRDPRRWIYLLIVPAVAFIGWDGFHLGTTFFEWMNGVAASARRGDPAPPSIQTWNAFTQSTALFAATWRIAAGVMGLAAGWLERRSL